MATWRKVIVSGSDAELNTLQIGGGSGGSGVTLSTVGAVTADAAITAGSSFIIGSADINETDLEKLDGITNGAGAANKALVLDGSADIVSGINNLLVSRLEIDADTNYIDVATDLKVIAAADIVLDPGGNQVLPGSDAADDLGASGTQWKDLYVHGIGYIDQLGTDADPVAAYISSGEVDGTIIGGESAAAGTFTTLSSTGLTTLGDASGDTVTINAATINPANIAAGTDNTVVVYNGSTLVTDEIDSKVWDGNLVDTDGSGANNELVTWSDSDSIIGEGNLTFDGTTLAVTGNQTISGDLTVNGSTTTLATTNLAVQDAFIFAATGSATANVDAGLIVQSGSAVDSGSAIYHDKQDQRWAVAKGIGSVAVAVTALQHVVTGDFSKGTAPSSESGSYGVGEMWVDNSSDIWVRTA